MKRPRVLIDTNVLLSGLIWKGNESRLLDLSISGDVCLLLPEFVLEEARRVLMLKFPEHSHLLDEVIGLLTKEVLSHPTSINLEFAMTVLRDPNDAVVLASIIDSKPDYAVTGDKDLLTPEVQSVFLTCKCLQFLREFEENWN